MRRGEWESLFDKTFIGWVYFALFSVKIYFLLKKSVVIYLNKFLKIIKFLKKLIFNFLKKIKNSNFLKKLVINFFFWLYIKFKF